MTSNLMEGWEMRGWPHRAHSRFVERGGIVWHVQTMGEGPVVLLVHGTGASTHSFRAMMPLLAAHHTVVAMDLPGQGFSRAPRTFEPSLPAMAASIGELLEAIELTPVAAVGHSAGAAILARMTLDGVLHPTHLVGVGAALVPLRGMAAAVLAPAARAFSHTPLLSSIIALRSRDSVTVERMIRSTGSTLDAEGIELYRRLSERPRHIDAVLAMMASWELDALYGELPRLDVPFLLVGGEGDRATPPRQQHEAASRLANARVELMPGGHLVHEEAPARVARLVMDFLVTPEDCR